MRKRVLPVVALIWGSAIVARGLLVGFGDTGGSQHTGQVAAYLFGWALAAVGVSGLLALRHREWFEL